MQRPSPSVLAVAIATVLITTLARPEPARAQEVVVATAPAPSPAQAVNAANDGSRLLLGLALMGAGLVAGGAGFAVLYFCQQGSSCYGDATTYVGWGLAAPGIVPLVVGGILVYSVVGNSGRRTALPVARTLARVGASAVPLPGGGAIVGATFTF
jgi:hypothetical protein